MLNCCYTFGSISDQELGWYLQITRMALPGSLSFSPPLLNMCDMNNIVPIRLPIPGGRHYLYEFTHAFATHLFELV